MGPRIAALVPGLRPEPGTSAARGRAVRRKDAATIPGPARSAAPASAVRSGHHHTLSDTINTPFKWWRKSVKSLKMNCLFDVFLPPDATFIYPPSLKTIMMLAVLDYIDEQQGNVREVMTYLHQLITLSPELVPRIAYKIPFYYRKRWVCYLSPTRDGRVELAFTRGVELSNEQGLLEARGRKQVMSVTFGSVADIPAETVLEVLQEALLLDETVPYSPKKRP